MSKLSYLRVFASFVATIDIVKDLDGDGTPAAMADWVHLPGEAGDTITIEDASGEEVTLTSTDQVTTWGVKIRKITDASGAFQFGTGPGPMGQGSKGDQGETGSPGLISFRLAILTPIPAGTDLPEISLGTNGGSDTIEFQLNGVSFEGGALTANDTNYLTVTLLVRDDSNANPVTCGTLVTNLAGGNWAGTVGTKKVMTINGGGGVISLPPGYSLRLKTGHTGTGVILPTGFFEALTA